MEKERKVITPAEYEELVKRGNFGIYFSIGLFSVVGFGFFGFGGLLFVAVVAVFTYPKMVRNNLADIDEHFIVKDDTQQ